MANSFNILSRKFYNQYRNGLTFASNLTDFTNKLQGSVGDVVKLTEEVEIRTIVNETQSIPIIFDQLAFSTYGKFSAVGINFFDEGLYEGATVQVEYNGFTVANVQVQTITGISNNEWTFDSTDRTSILANLSNIVGGQENRNDFVFKVTSAPTQLRYSYGINQNSFTGTNYQSTLDSNDQDYNAPTIATTPSATTMNWVGSEIGSSLGTVTVEFIATVDTYRHQFTINHTFKIPYYIEGQQSNLSDSLNPSNLLSSNSIRYDNKYNFGAVSSYPAEFPIQGLNGNVGYFNENFNGLTNNYSVDNVVITNASGTGKLEATETNTITFDIYNSVGNWTTGSDTLIVSHSKLPTALEYANSNTSFDDNWIFDNVLNVEGAGTTAGTIITAFSFARDGVDFTKMAVTFRITFRAQDKLIITENSEFLLYVTAASQNLTTADTVDRVNLVLSTDNYSKNIDVDTLVTTNIVKYYPAWGAFAGSNLYDNFSGGDGDLWGCKFSFKTDITRGALITGVRFLIRMENPSTLVKFEVLSVPIDLGKIATYFDGTNTHQQKIIDTQNFNLNLPSSEPLSRLKLEALKPLLAASTQDWEGELGFQIPHRDWVENLAVASVFYDNTEPQNNLNFKSSNYASVSGFKCYGVIELMVSNDVEIEPTTYDIYSNLSSILDFDVAGWTGFIGATKYYDQIGDQVINLSESEDVQIKIEFTHSLGVLALIDLAGFVWIERNGTTTAPSFLSSSKDWTNPNNLLKATDTLITGNDTLVEVVSINNLVTFIFQTEKDNINAPLEYNVYGRLWNAN